MGMFSRSKDRVAPAPPPPGVEAAPAGLAGEQLEAIPSGPRRPMIVPADPDLAGDIAGPVLSSASAGLSGVTRAGAIPAAPADSHQPGETYRPMDRERRLYLEQMCTR